MSADFWALTEAARLPVACGLSALQIQSGDSRQRYSVLPLLSATSLTGMQAGLRGETASQIVAASLCLSLNPSSILGGWRKKGMRWISEMMRRVRF